MAPAEVAREVALRAPDPERAPSLSRRRRNKHSTRNGIKFARIAMQNLRMDQTDHPLISCDEWIRSSVARWVASRHRRSTETDSPAAPQADGTEIARTGLPHFKLTEHLHAPAGIMAPFHQEIAEEVSRALALCLADRIRWPYCSPMIAERCAELREETVGAHEVYRRYATRNDKRFLLPDLCDYDGLLAPLLGNSLSEQYGVGLRPQRSRRQYHLRPRLGCIPHQYNKAAGVETGDCCVQGVLCEDDREKFSG